MISASSGGFRDDFRRNIMNIRKAAERMARPPRTPPTMAPTGAFEDDAEDPDTLRGSFAPPEEVETNEEAVPLPEEIMEPDAKSVGWLAKPELERDCDCET